LIILVLNSSIKHPNKTTGNSFIADLVLREIESIRTIQFVCMCIFVAEA